MTSTIFNLFYLAKIKTDQVQVQTLSGHRVCSCSTFVSMLTSVLWYLKEHSDVRLTNQMSKSMWRHLNSRPMATWKHKCCVAEFENMELWMKVSHLCCLECFVGGLGGVEGGAAAHPQTAAECRELWRRDPESTRILVWSRDISTSLWPDLHQPSVDSRASSVRM